MHSVMQTYRAVSVLHCRHMRNFGKTLGHRRRRDRERSVLLPKMGVVKCFWNIAYDSMSKFQSVYSLRIWFSAWNRDFLRQLNIRHIEQKYIRQILTLSVFLDFVIPVCFTASVLLCIFIVVVNAAGNAFGRICLSVLFLLCLLKALT